MSDQRLSAPDDQHDREAAAQGLDASVFIEAGAGTGKSTTLVARIINTLSDAARDVDVSQIAAITFTERAGGELRSRLRSGLVEAATKSPGDARILGALERLDTATVGTIHSFAQTLLRTHALSAGLPLGFTMATGADASDARRQRARAVVEDWQTSLDDRNQHILSSYGIALTDLRGLVTEIDTAGLRLSDPAFAVPDEATAAGRQARVADAIDDLLRDAAESCSDHEDKVMVALRSGLPALADLLRDGDEDALLAEYATLVKGSHPAFKLGGGGSQKNWTGGSPKEWRDRAKAFEPDVLACLMAPADRAVRTALARAWLLLHQARDERARAGVLEFDDLLSMARDLLRDQPDVRRQVHDAFRVVLVDEFQDTDPVQWQLIRLITADPDDAHAEPMPLPGRLIVVGDPKQAIYSFRGADIDTYLQARALFEDESAPLGDVRSLSTNFRSVEPVLHQVNAIFGAAMSEASHQVDYADLGVRHRPDHPTPGPAVTVLRDPAAPEGVDPVPKVASMRLEPQLIAQEIARAVHDGWQITTPDDDRNRHYTAAAQFSDIAILYPARTGVPALLDALDDAGVPYRSADSGLVFARPAVLGILSAIAVIDDAACELDLWAALKSPLFGCADDDLVRHRRQGGRWNIDAKAEFPSGPVGDAMATLRAIRRASGVPQPVVVIDALLEATRLQETLAFTSRGAFEADCVRMVRAHAQRWQDDGGVGLADYLAAVKDGDSDTGAASLAEPNDRDDNAVRLMTVFQAKGLEFPIVVVGGMANQIYSPAPSVGIVDAAHYEWSLAGGLRSPGFADWDAHDRIPRKNAERVRVSYVACTRARDHLILSVCGERGTAKPPHSSLLWDAVPRTDEHVTALDEVPVVARGVAFEPPAPLPADWDETVTEVRARSRAPFIAAPSAGAGLALGLAPDSPAPTIEDDTPFSATEEGSERQARETRDGRPLGIAVHAALDTLVRAGGTPDAVAIQAASQEAADAEATVVNASEVAARVTAALGTDVMVEALAAPRRWSELYLAAPVDLDGITLVEGFADLVFESPDGLVLVDYKTDETIGDLTLAHYREQLSSYGELLRRVTGLAPVRTCIVHAQPGAGQVIDL